MMKKIMKRMTLVSSIILLFAGQAAFAVPVTEIGDAGNTIGTAQTVGAGTTSIAGSGDNGDVDMFSFSWAGGSLVIDAFGSTFDTQLWLFDALGFGVQSNDDPSGNASCGGVFGLQSCIDLTAGLAAGTYYLAISDFNNDPIGSTCGISDQCTWSGELTGWTDPAGQGTAGFTINFSSAVGGTAVPEPGTLALLGLGLASLGFARRRRT